MAPKVIMLPVALLLDRSLPAGARVLYGVLMYLADRSGQCDVSHRRLQQLAGVRSHVTICTYVRALVSAGWLETRPLPGHRLRYVLRDPHHRARERLLPAVKQRLEKAAFKGEALMREWLTALVDCDEHVDGVRPGFLQNPLSDQPMEYDRLYLSRVAFEFNGPQHYGPTDQFPDVTQAKEQQARDAMKKGISLDHGVHLVIVRTEDLSFEGMRAKIGDLLPLREVERDDPVVRYLESVSKAYCLKALGGARPRSGDPR
ncbi:MAG: ArsR family transcriptional regulator [Bacillota bacterium]|nr:ArsR family transcriptional regulator [Bacillota bacterium]MDI7250133.1 ArsR family transcriptional regulator [Bacillota bacterium]